MLRANPWSYTRDEQFPPSPQKRIELNKTARNERRKLSANVLNTVSAATITIGGIAPAVAFLYGTMPLPPAAALISGVTGCFMGAAILHWIARRLLADLEE